MPKVAIYPGSFDPVTYGHIDIIQRGLDVFDSIIVAVLQNPAKKSLFSVAERMEYLNENLKELPNISVDTFNGLLIDYVAEKNADGILRGMRAVSDFEYEFQMALMNRRMNRDIQTVFLMTGLSWIFTSSSIIKEVAQFGGNVHGMVPPMVEEALKQKFAKA